MTKGLVLVFLFGISVVMVTPMMRMRQAQPLSYSNGNGKEASILRRVYRWKKQFVLRCCPGFMGPNCQKACFSCRGYAALKEKLTNIERLVHEAYNGYEGRQTARPDDRPMVPTVAFHPTSSGHDKTQYGTKPYHRQTGRAYFGQGRVDTFQRPVVVEKPPEMVVALGGFPNDENWMDEGNNQTASGAIQSDQTRNESSADAITASASGKSPRQPDGSKLYPKWSQEQTMEPGDVVKDGFTTSRSPTAEMENVWKHWDEEFQIRLSTVERQVLELENKLSALNSILGSVTSLSDTIVDLNKRVATLETLSGIPDAVTQSNLNPKDGRRTIRNREHKEKKDNDAGAEFDPNRTKNKGPPSKSEENSQSSNAENHFSKSHKSRIPPANLAFNHSQSGLKFKNGTNAMKRNNPQGFINSTADPEGNRLTNNGSSKSSPPCANLCQGQNFPSRPPPPPLPDKEIVENVFTDSPDLVDALGRGHKTFHQHLKTILNRNYSTGKDSSTKAPTSRSAPRQRTANPKDSGLVIKINEGFTGSIVFGDKSQSSNERSDLNSVQNSDRRNGQVRRDFKLQRGNMADRDGSHREDKIGRHMTMRSSNALPLSSVSTSVLLNVLCFSVIVMFTR